MEVMIRIKLITVFFAVLLSMLSWNYVLAASPNEDLLISALSGDLEGVEAALKKGADINTR
jgi:hypothetical protein